MKRFTRYKLSVVLAACLGTALAVSTAQAGQIGADLRQAMQNSGDVSFIVQFSDQLDLGSFPGKGKGKGMQRSALLWALKDQADVSQSDAVKLLRANGAKKLFQLWSINALAVTASPAAIEELAALPGVDSVKLDSSLKQQTPQPAAAATSEWNLDSIRAPGMWTAGYDGTGTVVASMDSGVDVLHPDLAASWRGGSTGWYDPNGEHATPYDSTGHGTQSTSLMVGGDAGGTSIGVAPGAQWIAVKIFNDAGEAKLSEIHKGFQWLLDPDGNPNTNNDVADVVNNSWGFDGLVNQCFTEFNPDIALLKAVGIAVVFSAGNRGSLGSVSPANNPDSFAVGSVDSSHNIANYSSRGPSACDSGFFPEVVAPGDNVRAADRTLNGQYPNSYATVFGTSFAAPHVAGTMALLRQANPNATVAELEQALTDSAVDLDPSTAGADNISGYGLIDAVAANDWLVNNPHPACSDADGDGFFAEEGCGTALDCKASDPNINPGACDIKRDGIDQDCSGRDRRKGQSCPVVDDGGGGTDPVPDPDPEPDPVFGVEGKGKTCSDGRDNDGDGLSDCSDPDCNRNKACK
jgi:serine protease AprX